MLEVGIIAAAILIGSLALIITISIRERRKRRAAMLKNALNAVDGRRP